MQDNRPTKEKILRKSAELFAERGYGDVSMKDIAAAVGITSASIYNHYDGKETILELIYAYFRDNSLRTRMTPEQYLPVLRAGGPLEIIAIFYYEWDEQADMMMDATRIVWIRKMIDPRATRLYVEYVMEESLRYCREVFQKGREIGRIRNSEEDLETLAMGILSTRVFSASSVVLDRDSEKWEQYGQRMLEMLSKVLDLSDPIINNIQE